MNEMSVKKMEELLANEEFTAKIANAGSYEKAYELFCENGVEATFEAFMDFIEATRAQMESNGYLAPDCELGPEMLDMVSGGRWYHSVVCWALAGAAFAAGMSGAGVILVVAGIALWNKK